MLLPVVKEQYGKKKPITQEEFEKMNQEFLDMMAAEEKRLGIGSEEFK